MSYAGLIETVSSGVIHIEFFSSQSERLGSGSGFISNGYLITNNHVYKGAINSSSVKLSWILDLSFGKRSEPLTYSSEIFSNMLVRGSDENNKDFAILNIPELRNQELFNFDLAVPCSNKIVDDVFILGFPFEHQNLVAHKAMISSKFIQKDVSVIQLDGSVNHSNSGGPLINLDGSVIGIVTRKCNGLTRVFDELRKSFDVNIQTAEQIKATIRIGGLNLNETLIKGQMQLKCLAEEILRSANVGIGYAFSIEYVWEDLQRLKENN